MRGVKIAIAVMSVLIVLGTTVVVATLIRRMGASTGPTAAPVVAMQTAAVAEEPAGTTIVGIAAVGDRLAVQLHGGGPDRVVFVDPHTALVSGRFSLGK